MICSLLDPNDCPKRIIIYNKKLVKLNEYRTEEESEHKKFMNFGENHYILLIIS